MAAVGSIFPSSTDNGSSAQDKLPQTSLANQSTFLTLLVSQLKNQNPMNPMDGTSFVTQLAQFSALEQNVAMRQDLDALVAKYAPTTATPATESSTNS